MRQRRRLDEEEEDEPDEDDKGKKPMRQPRSAGGGGGVPIEVVSKYAKCFKVRLGGYLIVFYISATGKASRKNIEILHTYVMRSSALLCSTRRHRLANKHAVVVANSF